VQEPRKPEADARSFKVIAPPEILLRLPRAEVIEGLALA